MSPATWQDHLASYRSPHLELFNNEFVEKWGAKVWSPLEADRRAAHHLHIQLTSRLATQPLSIGMELATLNSISEFFGAARSASEKNFGASHFDPLVWHVFNTLIRPFTVKWHNRDLASASTADRKEFGAEFAPLQRVLIRLDELLVDICEGNQSSAAISSLSALDERSPEKPSSGKILIDALIMKGGGVKGLAFAGAMRELERFFEFRSFVGTSAGAIAAVLFAAGAGGAELEETLRRKPFREFLDGKAWMLPFTFWSLRGLHPGYTFMNWLREELHKRIRRHADIKMEDLPKRAVVYASARGAGEVTFDKTGEHKDTAVHTAVRCSMSIPYFFQPQWIDNRRVYDGGLLNNYPVQIFLDQEKERGAHAAAPKFIALYLGSTRPKPINPSTVFEELLSIQIDRNDAKLVDRYQSQTILIDSEPIGTIDFDLTDQEKDYLVVRGRAATLGHLAGRSDLESFGLCDLKQLQAEAEELQTVAESLRVAIEAKRRARVRSRRCMTIAIIAVCALVGLGWLYVPVPSPPQICELAATLQLISDPKEKRPLFLTLWVGGRADRYPVELGKPVELKVQPEDVSEYTLALEWSDNSLSYFEPFSGCKPVIDRKSKDERSSLRLAPRR